QAEEILRVVENALGDTLAADAREEALAGIAAVLPAPADQAAVLSETERRMLEYALDLADDEIATDGSDFTDEEEDALAELRRIVTKPIAADRAAVLREAARHLYTALFPAVYADMGQKAAEGVNRAASELRRLADEAHPEPGVRHVHITIHHPDPTTAHTAALCIADLIRGEYGDSLNLAITTDAPDAGAAPPRPAGEAPDTTADTFAGGSYLTAEHDTLGMIAARHGGDRLAWEMANPWVTSSAMGRTAGLRVAIPAQAGPAAGARQDGAPDDVVTELTEAEFHDAAGKALARLGLTYAELEDQARRRDFSSAQARSLWVTIGGAAPAGARQDREAQ